MSDDLVTRLEVGVRRQDRKAADNNTAERALAKEAAARIRELEAELAALREARGGMSKHAYSSIYNQGFEAGKFAAREARGVRVKPLEWSYGTHKSEIGFYVAGRYSCRPWGGNWTAWRDDDCLYDAPHGSRGTSTLDQAKAAAQSDYERRILAALEPAPVTVAQLDEVNEKLTYDELGAVFGDRMPIQVASILAHGEDYASPLDARKAVNAALRALADAGEAEE